MKEGSSVCLITNSTGVSTKLVYNYKLLKRKRIIIKKIFTPEQGYYGTYLNGEPVPNERLESIPLISLYGERFKPTEEDISDCDTMLFDIEDAGVRYFTTISTLFYSLKAAKSAGLDIIVTDRPNPLNANQIRGPLIDKNNYSFVGIRRMPIRFGLTPGELAKYFNKEIGSRLEVVPMQDYDRKKYHDEILNFYIPLSLHLPTIESVINYQAFCLLEATNISVGRGTPNPFMQFGSSFLEDFSFKDHGIVLRKTKFRPSYSIYKDKMINGFFIHIIDRKKYDPFKLVIALLKYSIEKKDFEIDEKHMQILYGSSKIIDYIKNGYDYEFISEKWKNDEMIFRKEVESFKLY